MLCSGSDNQRLGAVINLATHCVRIAALELTAGSYLGQLKKNNAAAGFEAAAAFAPNQEEKGLPVSRVRMLNFCSPSVGRRAQVD